MRDALCICCWIESLAVLALACNHRGSPCALPVKSPLFVGWEWHSLLCVPLVQNTVTIMHDDDFSLTAAVRGSKYCLAPSGHGCGVQLSQYMLHGCVPLLNRLGPT
jgi:hypothetical protein